MSHETRLVSALAVIAAATLVAPSALGQPQILFSEYGGGQQFWIPVELFAARSSTGGSPNFIEDPLADTPLSGKAFYFPFSADDPDSSPTVFLDFWAQYDVLPADLPETFDLTGTWYFWTRCQQPPEEDSVKYNKDSDWLVVNGDPGDLTEISPTDVQWFTAAQASVREQDRIVNDVHRAGGILPLWAWIGYQGPPEDNLKRPKTVTVIDGKFSFRIYEAEAYDLNGRIDVICWANSDTYWPTDDDFINAVGMGDCEAQHTTSGVAPPSNHDDSDVRLTITGTDLHLVTGVRLIPVGGGSEIPGTSFSLNQDNTELSADFATTGAPQGVYHISTHQDHPCWPRWLLNSFEVTCGTPTVMTGVSPGSVTDPGGSVGLTVSGTNVTLLDSLTLRLGTDVTAYTLIPGTDLAINGSDLTANFSLGCVPGGSYSVMGARNSGCPVTNLHRGFAVFKSPHPGACVWRPWAAPWSNLNLEDIPDSPPDVYNPRNWDYSRNQATALGMTLDLPPGGGDHALHWFIGAQPPDFPAASGNGGVFQEITVMPDVPLEYSFWWKGGVDDNTESWFEFMLIDGPFSIWDADGYNEVDQGVNNPYLIRKIVFDGGPGSFDWQQLTDTSPVDTGPHGDRPATIAPTGSVVTVVLKAGRYPGGNIEALFDNVVVSQSGGPNLLVNGDFESDDSVWPCENEAMFRDPCERRDGEQNGFWLKSEFVILPPCFDPFADIDEDSDVDQDDFAAFQICYTGTGIGPVSDECRCFDRPELPGFPQGDNDIDSTDLTAFEACASGANVPADICCDNSQELVACCLPGDTCDDLTECECTKQGGTSKGGSTDCLTVTCP